MLHAFDADAGHRCALQRAEQHAPERVAQRDAEPALERFGHELAVGVGQRVLLDVQAARLDQVAPILSNQCFCHVSSPCNAALLPTELRGTIGSSVADLLAITSSKARRSAAPGSAW